MLKKKHVIFRTTASVDQARRLLQSQTVAGSPSADNLPALMKDTLSADQTPFRGEIDGTRFKLTRRVRGRRVRIDVEGSLEGKPDGGTELRASMSPPPLLLASVVAGLLTILIMSGGLALSAGPAWLALLLAAVPVLGLSSKLYEAETSRTFSALRDAVPEHPPAAIEPIASPQADAGEREPEKVRP